MKRSLALVMAVLVTSAGCGVVFVEGPHVVEAKVTCTQDFTLPLVDVAVAVVGIATPFILDATALDGKPNFVVYSGMWITGVAAAISSVIGIQKVKRCRRSVAAPLPASTPAPMPSPAP
jgi:hypothetical protein